VRSVPADMALALRAEGCAWRDVVQEIAQAAALPPMVLPLPAGVPSRQVRWPIADLAPKAEFHHLVETTAVVIFGSPFSWGNKNPPTLHRLRVSELVDLR
jgi:hypothetical protein